jgi:hypothetical protein
MVIESCEARKMVRFLPSFFSFAFLSCPSFLPSLFLCVRMSIYIHTYIYMCVCVCVCMCAFVHLHYTCGRKEDQCGERSVTVPSLLLFLSTTLGVRLPV